jgi:hypothetical protein
MRRRVRHRATSALALAPALVLGSAAAEAPPGLAAILRCEERSAPGRVVCEVEAEVPSGHLVWADVLVQETPPFARALRSRIALAEASARTETRVRLPIALIAASEGAGSVTVRFRAVVCDESETRCLTGSTTVQGEVRVGALR